MPNKCDESVLVNPKDPSIFCLYETKVLFDRVCSPITANITQELIYTTA